MRRTPKNSNISFKCHYCGKGSDKNLVMHRTTDIPSKSLERDRRLVSGKYLTRSRSVHSTYLPPLNQTTDYTYIPGKTLTEDDLREELTQVKKRYTALNREHDLLKTHLRIATNDLKKREHEIENLLVDPITMTKSQEQLELNSLKRKIIQYERTLREKTLEINTLMADKNIFNATDTKQKMRKLEEDCAKLKHIIGKSVPFAELEAERTKLAALIETLQRENEELQHVVEGIFQDSDNNSILDTNGVKDPKVLSKLREEAAVRKNEVERYQHALSSLIRKKSLPSLAVSQKHIKRSISATPKTVEKNISAENRNGFQLPSNQLTAKKTKYHKSSKQIKKISSYPLQPSAYPTKYAQIESEKKENLKGAKTKSNISKKERLNSSENSLKQPVKHVNHLLNYEEAESSAKSPDLLTPVESTEEEKDKKKKRSDYYESSGASSQVTNGDYDNDSNIGALNAEYREKETEDRLGSLITALRCQLLREEMIQTRVISF